MRRRAVFGLAALSLGGSLSVVLAGAPETDVTSWPQFRGRHAAGVADGANLPDAWDANGTSGILWKVRIPRLAHSSPVVWGDQVFVTTAISSRPFPSVPTGRTAIPGSNGTGSAAS